MALKRIFFGFRPKDFYHRNNPDETISYNDASQKKKKNATRADLSERIECQYGQRSGKRVMLKFPEGGGRGVKCSLWESVGTRLTSIYSDPLKSSWLNLIRITNHYLDKGLKQRTREIHLRFLMREHIFNLTIFQQTSRPRSLSFFQFRPWICIFVLLCSITVVF